MLCDSHRMKPSSSSVGTRPLGFILRYSGVSTTPDCMPASMRSYGRLSSSRHQSAFFTLTELVRPQIFSIVSPRNPAAWPLKTCGLSISARIARRQVAAVEPPDQLAAAELVVVVHRDDPVAAAAQLLEHRGREIVLHAHVQALHPAEARAG